MAYRRCAISTAHLFTVAPGCEDQELRTDPRSPAAPPVANVTDKTLPNDPLVT